MIANLVRGAGISEGTLRRAFADELARGRASAAAKITETLFNKALSGDVACLIFWVKCRVPGWREVVRAEITGADGQPVVAPPTGVILVPASIAEGEWEKIVAKQQATLMATSATRRIERAKNNEH
jgi:hypothetical protein